MKLPFISREVYEKALADLEYERSRSDRLLTLLRFKARRARKKPAPVIPPPSDPVPASVSWAIEERSGGDPFLRRYLHRYAQDQLSNNKEPSEIAELIRYGEADDSE